MGFVYHANYLVWMDMARTEHLRGAGMSYRALEEQGLFLAVTEAGIRYRQPARYDDLIRVRCWVRELASRRVTFGYAIERDPTDALLATAQTALIALDRDHALARIPARVRDLLAISPDPVRV
jgi:acyl-CoA thioester hydrolase